MSKDSRLGADPLSWVDPQATTEVRKDPASEGAKSGSAKPEAAPMPAPENPAQTETHADRLFSPARSNEEISMDKQKVKIKQILETPAVVKHLQDLAQSLESGVIRAEGGTDSLVLSVPASMEFEMKASRKKDKAKCSLEISWEDDGSVPGGFKVENE